MDAFERRAWQSYFKNVSRARIDRGMTKFSVGELEWLAVSHGGKIARACLAAAETLTWELWGEIERLDSDIEQWMPPFRELAGGRMVEV